MIPLDTYVLLGWMDGDTAKLSKSARNRINAELKGGEILVSSISAWETSMLIDHGRVALSKAVSE